MHRFKMNNQMKHTFLFLVLYTFGGLCNAQEYTRQDSLRGSITPERAWWDLSYYHLDILVDIENQTIQGSNTIRYKVLESNQLMQIDLQPPMEITRITQHGQDLKSTREGNVYLIELTENQISGTYDEIHVQFSGKPKVANRPPWESGMVWEKDSLGNPFVSSISWGGSSEWWPSKDQNYDEVDSMRISVNVPEKLTAVANGRLTGVNKLNNKTKTYHWLVKNPINNYSVNFNIGNYVHFSEVYIGENGPLDCNYYVLKQNLKKAKKHFEQVSGMLEAFEHWFGPYPFYEDSYKLVETPYLGMEHQSAITYGNGYQNGISGYDWRENEWVDKFDNIIIHESGHEWFANNITFKDIADIWIHESFTTYSEGLYIEYHYDKEAGDSYQVSIKRDIQNDKPIIGNYGVFNKDYSSSEVYYKGATIIHMLRQIVDDDEKWRDILRGLCKEFYHQTVTTTQIEDYIASQSGLNLDYFWDQYLRTTQVPVFEYRLYDNKLFYRYFNAIEEFKMPLKIRLNGKEEWIYPTTEWQQNAGNFDRVELTVDRNFYVPVLYSNPRK